MGLVDWWVGGLVGLVDWWGWWIGGVGGLMRFSLGTCFLNSFVFFQKLVLIRESLTLLGYNAIPVCHHSSLCTYIMNKLSHMTRSYVFSTECVQHCTALCNPLQH